MVYRLGMDKVLPLRETRDSLGQRVDAAHYTDEITIITRNGEARAVIVSYESYQHLRRGAAGQDAGAAVGQTSAGHPRDAPESNTPQTGSDQPVHRGSQPLP